MDSQPTKPKPGNLVVLMKAPPGLLDGLPEDDQKAISETIGKPIKVVGYDDAGRVELEFTNNDGVIVEMRFLSADPLVPDSSSFIVRLPAVVSMNQSESAQASEYAATTTWGGSGEIRYAFA